MPADARLEAGGEGGYVDEEDSDNADHAEGADVALFHDAEHGFAVAAAAQGVGEVSQTRSRAFDGAEATMDGYAVGGIVFF